MDALAKIGLMVALSSAQKALQNAQSHVHDESLRQALNALQTALSGAITALATA